MNATQHITRFRTNPVEILIFLIISGIFGNSLYELLYIHDGFHPAALSPMTSNPISEGRNIASTAPAASALSLSTMDLSCDEQITKDTVSEKMRLTGTLCGETLDSESNSSQKITVTNQTNRFSATVFTGSSSLKYSTDYIPLESGINKIQIEIFHANASAHKQSVEITRK